MANGKQEEYTVRLGGRDITFVERAGLTDAEALLLARSKLASEQGIGASTREFFSQLGEKVAQPVERGITALGTRPDQPVAGAQALGRAAGALVPRTPEEAAVLLLFGGQPALSRIPGIRQAVSTAPRRIVTATGTGALAAGLTGGDPLAGATTGAIPSVLGETATGVVNVARLAHQRVGSPLKGGEAPIKPELAARETTATAQGFRRDMPDLAPLLKEGSAAEIRRLPATAPRAMGQVMRDLYERIAKKVPELPGIIEMSDGSKMLNPVPVPAKAALAGLINLKAEARAVKDPARNYDPVRLAREVEDLTQRAIAAQDLSLAVEYGQKVAEYGKVIFMFGNGRGTPGVFSPETHMFRGPTVAQNQVNTATLSRDLGNEIGAGGDIIRFPHTWQAITGSKSFADLKARVGLAHATGAIGLPAVTFRPGGGVARVTPRSEGFPFIRPTGEAEQFRPLSSPFLNLGALFGKKQIEEQLR